MNPVRLLLLLTLLAPLPGRGQTADFPNPPSGHVLDTGRWLSDHQRTALEEELRRVRNEHQLDVLVILWDRHLPHNVHLDELARRLGETWSREEFWTVVLHVPHSLQHPAISFGGLVPTSMPRNAVTEGVRRATTRGMKELSPQDRIASTALEVAEEFIFLHNLRNLAQSAFRSELADRHQEHEARKSRALALGIAASIIGLALAAGLLWLVLTHRKRTSTLQFPDTRWRRRLGASWSGGRDLVVTIPAKG